MKTCDICGREVKKLLDVKEDYLSFDVKEVCSSCADLINDSIAKLNHVNNKILRKAKISLISGLILRLREKYKSKERNTSPPMTSFEC